MSAIVHSTVKPDEQVRQLALESSRILEAMSSNGNSVVLQVQDAGNPETVALLPDIVTTLLKDILSQLARGKAISILPEDTMLTTQEAANILNVSRPFFVQLLEKDRIPYQRLGSHRKVRLQDLLHFKDQADKKQDLALKQLANEAQELNLGY